VRCGSQYFGLTLLKKSMLQPSFVRNAFRMLSLVIMKDKKLLFSVTAKDCDWQEMTAGGPGGQHQNRKKTAIRCIHRASGAVGFSREHKSQLENKREAFVRMANTATFLNWNRIQAAKMLGQPDPEKIVDDMMSPKNLKIEYRTEKGWEKEGEAP
jgi:protein subunit release factor B